MRRRLVLMWIYTLAALLLRPGLGAAPIPVLIVDGRNNHNWQVTTDAVRATLEATGRFAVTVSTAPDSRIPPHLRAPKSSDDRVQRQFAEASTQFKKLTEPAQKLAWQDWEKWNPNFRAYDCVVLNYNGPMWPEPMRQNFVDYIRSGGGVLFIHAANNAFPNWKEYNDIIGLGWRTASHGQAIKYDADRGQPFVDEQALHSAHGAKHPFMVTVRQPEHPVMRGLPREWMHARDELYHHMRGSSKNLTVLSTAWSDPEQRGTGQHEPLTWEVSYGKGRSIVTTMGHFYRGDRIWDALYCVGFQTVVARSCEYLATGSVTLPVPPHFPGSAAPSIQPPHQVDWSFSEAIGVDGPAITAQRKKVNNPYCVLTPAEERSTFDLADGYVAELVAAEPLVEEPVLTVWDGNGAMYVAEMRSYMQDEHGTGTKQLRNGRVKRLEDTDGDGRMDRVSVFVDQLNLPRMILPLDDWIAIRESDTMDVFAYRDTDGDGVADERKTLFEYGPRGRNSPEKSVEHQDSGLLWNLDNWIYITYNMERYRFTDGTWRAQPQPGHWTQWGLTHDDVGRLYWIQNSGPLVGAQLHPKYWFTVRRLAQRGINGSPITLGDPYEPDFMNVKSLCLLNDRGGAAAEVRSFTSACGQSVFRGDKLPFADRGRYFFVDPTIHVLRRANIEDQDGKIMLSKVESGDAEFLRSSDINCRFVNTATGPDGTLYVTDMYRGIIQDAPWMNPQAREFTRESGLASNKRKGRVWRIRHRDFKPGKRPQMLNESTVELVRHLSHANGWWRDTAQRLILLRPDREQVVPLLEGLVRYTQNRLGRLHALWTLEGMAELSDQLLREMLEDREPILRRAAVQIVENDVTRFLPELAALTRDSDPRVVEQLIYTLGTVDDERVEVMIQEAARGHLDDRGIMMATAISLWGKKHLPFSRTIQDGSAFDGMDEENLALLSADWRAAISNWDRGLQFPESMPDTVRRQITSGETQYYQYCVSCHGSDGQGMQVPGSDQRRAPALAGSERVKGNPSRLLPVFINGLTGPISGKTYPMAYMAPAKALGITRDDRLAEIVSFIRYAWGNEATPVSKEQVTQVRQELEHRDEPWTDEGLKRRTVE